MPAKAKTARTTRAPTATKKARAKATKATKPKQTAKPVTVTLARIEYSHPCSREYFKFLRRVRGSPSEEYLNAECGCFACVDARGPTPKGTNINEDTPILLKDIRRMRTDWADWVYNRVLTTGEKNRWNNEISKRRT